MPLSLLLALFAAPGDDAARAVLAGLVSAARANHSSATPKKGGQLTTLLVRAAAASARKQPREHQARAFLLAVGIGLDRSALMRSNPATALTWRRVETNPEREARLKVLGTPELHGRQDLAQHFAVSAALTALYGPRAAESAGVLKEVLDAQPGGSGFSFADLAADFSGVAFASWVIARPARLADIAGLEAFCVSPKGYVEGLSEKQFEARYGGVKDERFLSACKKARERAAALPAYRARK